jgi:hypothetical protein
MASLYGLTPQAVARQARFYYPSKPEASSTNLGLISTLGAARARITGCETTTRMPHCDTRTIRT